jgi:hypothetical protein
MCDTTYNLEILDYLAPNLSTYLESVAEILWFRASTSTASFLPYHAAQNQCHLPPMNTDFAFFQRTQNEKLETHRFKRRDQPFPTQKQVQTSSPLRLQIHHGQVNSFEDQEKAPC